MKLQFAKMHGLGNDFVIIDAVTRPMALTRDQARRLGRRRLGVGCDQILLIEPAAGADADFRCRIFNADGAEVEQCGNGVRCLARFIRERGLSGKASLVLETSGGLVETRSGRNAMIDVCMGEPRLEPADIPFAAPRRETLYPLLLNGAAVEAGVVSMGNPHAVIQVRGRGPGRGGIDRRGGLRARPVSAGGQHGFYADCRRGPHSFAGARARGWGNPGLRQRRLRRGRRGARERAAETGGGGGPARRTAQRGLARARPAGVDERSGDAGVRGQHRFMSGQQTQTGLAADLMSEQSAVEYLEKNPDFFERNEFLLEFLKVPHASGAAASLVERQLQILREQNRRCRQDLRDLIAAAQRHDRLSSRMHRLALALMEARDLDDAHQTLQEVLRGDFEIERVRLCLFPPPDRPLSLVHECVLNRSSRGMIVLRDFFAGNRPECGRLNASKMEFLFGRAGGQVQSAGLIPIQTGSVDGVLAIGSGDANRFHSGMGALFLARIGELVSRALQPLLR